MFTHLPRTHRLICTAVAIIAVGVIISCTLALAPRLAHADVVHLPADGAAAVAIGTPYVSDGQGAAIVGRPSYNVHPPRVLRPGGGYTARPDYMRRLRKGACVKAPGDPLQYSDVAVVTDGGAQLIQRMPDHRYSDAPATFRFPYVRHVAATWDGVYVCGATRVPVWVAFWRG